MGVVNVTPDSFSDGGRFLETGAAVAHAHALIRDGCDLLDIGGESTRPGSNPIAEEEELRRVIPVIDRLVAEASVPISVDTSKPAVAAAALGAGASIVNDVAANRSDPAMWEVVAGTGAGYIAMHMQGTPATMQSEPAYGDVVAEVGAFFADRLHRLAAAGIAAEQVVLDVGIGFGKNLEHNLALLGGLRHLGCAGRPLVVGVSRKSFIGRLLGTPTMERLSGALACSVLAIEAGVGMLRTHDVAETVQAARMTEAILARRRG